MEEENDELINNELIMAGVPNSIVTRLNRIGKAWFLSYTYYKNGHSNHLYWKNVPNALELRQRYFEEISEYHKVILAHAKEWNVSKLSRNHIGLTSEMLKNIIDEVVEE